MTIHSCWRPLRVNLTHGQLSTLIWGGTLIAVPGSPQVACRFPVLCAFEPVEVSLSMWVAEWDSRQPSHGLLEGTPQSLAYLAGACKSPSCSFACRVAVEKSNSRVCDQFLKSHSNHRSLLTPLFPPPLLFGSVFCQKNGCSTHSLVQHAGESSKRHWALSDIRKVNWTSDNATTDPLRTHF